jgi:hypothetical protein
MFGSLVVCLPTEFAGGETRTAGAVCRPMSQSCSGLLSTLMLSMRSCQLHQATGKGERQERQHVLCILIQGS